MHRVAITVFLILGLSVFLGSAWAGDEPLPELVMEKIDASLYPELVIPQLGSKYGVRETLKPQGQALLAVTVVVAPKWTETIEMARIESKDIKLAPGMGPEILMTGYFERQGEFRADDTGFSAYRSSDWKEQKQTVTMSVVFAVPPGLKSAELRLGPVKAKVEVPGKPTTPPDPAASLKVTVTKAAFVEQVQSQRRVGGLEPTPVTVLTNPNGRLLQLDIEVKPIRSNSLDDPNYFFWYTPYFSLLTDKGAFIPTCGEMFMDGLSDGVSHNLSKSGEGEFSPGTATLYFAVPENTSGYRLTYLGAAVAQGNLGAAPPAQKETSPAGASTTTPGTDKGKGTIQQFMKTN